MKRLLSLLLLLSAPAFAAGKLDFSYGYYSINAKANGKSSSISNPSALSIAYLMPLWEKTELNFGYTVLLADFSGSDMGYGLNVGMNYFLFSTPFDEKFRTESIEVEKYQIWKPYIGAGFYQRNFQSIKNSYAGLGLNVGVEKYYDSKMSFKGEMKYINLAGSGDSTATEMNLLVGVIFKF